MSRSRFRFALWLVLAALVPSCLTGCNSFNRLSRVEQMDREVRLDRIKNYSRLAEAYFLLGYECYTLAKESEARKDTERVREYADKSRLYNLHYRRLKNTVEEMRKEFDRDFPEEARKAAQAEAPSSGPAEKDADKPSEKIAPPPTGRVAPPPAESTLSRPER